MFVWLLGTAIGPPDLCLRKLLEKLDQAEKLMVQPVRPCLKDHWKGVGGRGVVVVEVGGGREEMCLCVWGREGGVEEMKLVRC